jgi:DNA-binding transcriptional MerR regulator
MQRPTQTLTIQEVSKRLNLTKHTLRFWEKKLDGVIVPLRTQGGQRRYTLEQLCVIEKIKHQKRKGLRLANIKDKLKNSHEPGQESSNSQRIDLLAEYIAKVVRSAVYNFFYERNLD